MARIYQRGKTWYIDYTASGSRIREAIGTSKKLAETVLKEKEAEIVKSEHHIVKRVDLPITELFRQFLEFIRINRRPYTHRRYEDVIKHFEDFIETQRDIYRVSDVKPHHMELYKSWRVNQPKNEGSEKTINRTTVNFELDAIRTLFNFSVRFHGLRSNPVKGIERFKVMKKSPRILTEEEVRQILSSSTGIFRSMFLVGFFTGMRKGELQNLIWDNVDFVNKLILVRPNGNWVPKTWEIRDIPMHPAVYKTLKNLPRRSQWVFTSKTGKQISHPRLAFLRVCRKLGITGVTFHTLRHTFASHLLTKKGVDIVTVSHLLGHKKIETTMIYLHTDLETMRKGVERLDFDENPETTWHKSGTKEGGRGAGYSRQKSKMVEIGGFEPPTSCVQSRRSPI
jgi:integrase